MPETVPTREMSPTGRWIRTAWASLSARWQAWTVPYDPTHPEAPQFRSMQVQTTLTLTPLVLLANWANVGVVAWTFRNTFNPIALGAWTLATLAASSAGLGAWLTWRAGRWPRRNSNRTLARTAHNATLLAALWAVPMLTGYPSGDSTQRSLLVGLTVGMICAGGFALAAIPRAAFQYVIVLSVGLTAGYTLGGAQQHLLSLLLAPLYSGIVLATVVTNSRQMGGRLVAEADSARQKRVVDLLLDDFQENARDWLWEVSEDGCLRYVSLRLAEAFDRPPESLSGAPFIALIRGTTREPDEVEARALRMLANALVDANAFRDLQVPVFVAGERRWWSLSGKRLFDDRQRPVGWRGVGSDVTRARHQSAELQRLANVDALTGLANRHQFQARMRAGGNELFTLFYLDLDDFKTINDLHGHLVGDEVLKCVAARFRSAVREDDLLARIGGDEFALLSFNHADRDGALATARRLIDSLMHPIAVEDLRLRVGTCIGIVPSGSCDAPSEGLTRLADMALYAAKAEGRNTFKFFEGPMEAAARRRLSLLTDLHEAVSDGDVTLHYQPLIDFATGRVAGAEALMRWQHPTRGSVSPAEFVPLAEESGLIVGMGLWALREACTAAHSWPGHMRVAVNVSALQFASPSLVTDLQRVLRETGLAPQRLELEITESVLIADGRSARTTLGTLRDMGVRVALDDFGTGYSSLAYIKSYPLDALKIDGAFVRSLNGDRESLAVIRAIVQLARALRLNVTAEGIETQEQFDILRALNCTDAQGFLLGRPMSANDLAAFHEAWKGIERRRSAA